MPRLTLSATLLHQRGSLAKAVRDLLDVALQPEQVHVFTGTVGSLRLPGGTTFLQKLRMLVGSGASVVLVFGENPAKMGVEQQELMRGLVNAGVRVFHKKTMHAKLIRAKRRSTVQVYIGSANMTQSAFDWSDELAVRAAVDSPETQRALDDYVQLKLKGCEPVEDWFPFWGSP